jgi:hypothetical protein
MIATVLTTRCREPGPLSPWVHSRDSSRDKVSRAGIPAESRQSCRDSGVMARDVRRILPSILPFWQDTHAPLPGHLSRHFVRRAYAPISTRRTARPISTHHRNMSMPSTYSWDVSTFPAFLDISQRCVPGMDISEKARSPHNLCPSALVSKLAFESGWKRSPFLMRMRVENETTTHHPRRSKWLTARVYLHKFFLSFNVLILLGTCVSSRQNDTLGASVAGRNLCPSSFANWPKPGHCGRSPTG